jgi:hypothetical protein
LRESQPQQVSVAQVPAVPEFAEQVLGLLLLAEFLRQAPVSALAQVPGLRGWVQPQVLPLPPPES